MSLSDNIKNYRLKRNITQEQLATVLGVSAQAVSKWETSDTYPDGALLTPLANALGVSLDRLFDNNAYNMSELSCHLNGIIASASREERFERVRDVCWQIQKALFNTAVSYDIGGYSLDEYKNVSSASAYVSDQGFTHICNGKAPFFALFPEKDDCFTDAIADGGEVRKVFEVLSRSETMRAVIFVFRKEYNFLFDPMYLAKECEIPDEMTGTVIDDLLSLKMIRKNELEIDGIPTTLYFTNPRYQLLALLLIATQVNYAEAMCNYSLVRSKPYLNN